jgi:outer membrane biosynthesis protein TonB
MRKDLITSIVAHLVLIAIIGVINPISAMFRPKPEIIIVKTFEMEGGGPSAKSAKEEPAKIAPPKSGKETPKEEADDAVNIKPPKKDAAAVEKPKEKKKKEREIEKQKQEEDQKPAEEASKEDSSPKEDASGGIEVNEKVGGTGSGIGKGSGKGNLPYNIGMVLSVIERNWRNVVTDANPITCTVFFQIDRYGYVIGDPIIEKSSGITPFDQSCLLAIRRAGQFPAFPPNFNYAHLGLHLDFVYQPGT